MSMWNSLAKNKNKQFFLNEYKKYPKKPNVVQLLGNILSSINFLSVSYWIYVTVVPPRQYKWLLYSLDNLVIINY